VISEAGAIEGSVVDGLGALGGVSVEVFPAGSTDPADLVVTTTSEEDGTFAFVALLPGIYDLVLSLDGYEGETVSGVLVGVGETASVGEITLTQTPAP
jgi:hypothetical protein